MIEFVNLFVIINGARTGQTMAFQVEEEIACLSENRMNCDLNL
jgi:hypothetical protein